MSKIKLKDREHVEVVLKVSKIREVFKEGEGFYSFKDKLRCIKATHSTVINSTCFPCTRKGDKDLIKFIKEQLYIK